VNLREITVTAMDENGWQMASEGFPKTSRLKSNAQFRAVMDRRMKFADSLLTVFAAANGLEASRLGISVGRTVGKAVWRNRAKRLIREVWRKKNATMPQGYDYVVMMTRRNRPDMPTCQEVERSLGALIEKINARYEAL
jgi:ribonuclease P protein component